MMLADDFLSVWNPLALKLGKGWGKKQPQKLWLFYLPGGGGGVNHNNSGDTLFINMIYIPCCVYNPIFKTSFRRSEGEKNERNVKLGCS